MEKRDGRQVDGERDDEGPEGDRDEHPPADGGQAGQPAGDVQGGLGRRPVVRGRIQAPSSSPAKSLAFAIVVGGGARRAFAGRSCAGVDLDPVVPASAWYEPLSWPGSPLRQGSDLGRRLPPMARARFGSRKTWSSTPTTGRIRSWPRWTTRLGEPKACLSPSAERPAAMPSWCSTASQPSSTAGSVARST